MRKKTGKTLSEDYREGKKEEKEKSKSEEPTEIKKKKKKKSPIEHAKAALGGLGLNLAGTSAPIVGIGAGSLMKNLGAISKFSTVEGTLSSLANMEKKERKKKEK